MDLRNLDTKNNTFIIGRNYVLQERIGGGSFGQIYSAIDRTTNSSVAVKLEQCGHGRSSTLTREAQVLAHVRRETGFPRFYAFGKEENLAFIVMDILGPNLEKLFKLCGNRFSLKTVLLLADQILTRIETLHKKDYIHRDIKPENFCIGNEKNSPNLFLIDLGLARSYKEMNGQHIPCVQKRGLTGTARYASINAHRGFEQSRRDDLESIGYTLIYFLKGELPWMNVKAENKDEKYKLITEIKAQTPVDVLCKDLPQEFATYLNYVRKLEFTEAPDYKYLKRLFRTLFITNDYAVDYNFDWVRIMNNQSVKETLQTRLANAQADLYGEIESKKKIMMKNVELKRRVGFSDVEIPKIVTKQYIEGPTDSQNKLMKSGNQSNFCVTDPDTNKVNNLFTSLDKHKLNLPADNNMKNSSGSRKRGGLLEVSIKNGSTNSGGCSSRCRNFGDSLGMEVAPEFTANDFPGAKIQSTKPLVFNKSFHDQQKFYTCMCLSEENLDRGIKSMTTRKNCETFRSPQPNNEEQGDKRWFPWLFQKKQQQPQKPNTQKLIEDTNEASICEWDNGNCLENMLKDKKLIVLPLSKLLQEHEKALDVKKIVRSKGY